MYSDGPCYKDQGMLLLRRSSCFSRRPVKKSLGVRGFEAYKVDFWRIVVALVAIRVRERLKGYRMHVRVL